MLVTIILVMATACSTQKNTAKSRWWHAFNARYNTYYNGAQAYIEGSLEKEKGNKDNFTEIIPLYTVGNKKSQQLGSGQFDKAIEKAKKAIKRHSIKRKPEWTKNRRKNERDIEWLSRREYNPFLWKAWMLMGRAQFHKGQFDEAASTFSYMSRLYQTQPAIYGKARAWLARCYVEQQWLYDAEDVIRNMQRDSIDWRAKKEWDYTYADYYLHTQEYAKAVPYLRRVIKHEMRRKQRAREWFIMGQIQTLLGNKKEAFDAYRHVIRQNPDYEVEFNARIAMSEVMASDGRTRQTISRLKRMAASDKNKEYLDQVYYAMGNVYMAQRDTTHAIEAYEKGVEKGTRSGVEKGVLLLRLGDIYWEKDKYSDARRCYGQAIGLLDRDRKDYDQLSRRSVVLDELVPHTEAIHLQDSLQYLAQASEEERNAAIDRVIEALKKKEKEEKKKEQEQKAAEVMAQNGGNRERQPDPNNAKNVDTDSKGQWYFYNPMAVSQGKTTFQQLWGRRENVDDWQRVNKTVVGNLDTDEQQELTQEMQDSIAREEAIQDSLAQRKDSAQNDPHKREYYLAQLPFTEEQVKASNSIIMESLYQSGVIFKDKLDNLRLSYRQFERLLNQYPEYEHKDNVYYHLFLLHSRREETATAESYVQRLKKEYPESQWTTLLSDPYFAENARLGEHIEDSLYAATYEAFKHDKYDQVRTNTRISEQRFPTGANRDKFIFIGGLSKLNQGDANGCVEDMRTVVKNYPKSRISEMAGMIVKGVGEGRKLHGGKFDLGDIWSRRAVVLNDSDSIQSRTFVDERHTPFVFMYAYSPDSLNENQLLFEMARFNFTNFIVRNFDISIDNADGLHRMMVTGLRSYDEAHQYAQQVANNEAVAQRAVGARPIIISEKNMELLGQQFSYDDYDEYYNKHFAPIKVTKHYLLTEPAELGNLPEPDPRPVPGDTIPPATNKNEEENDDDIFSGSVIEDDSTLEIPETPEEPEAPAQPEQPVQPEKPEQPAQPEKPEKPEKPVQPEQPVQPEKPEKPEQPATPVQPAQPEQPVQDDVIEVEIEPEADDDYIEIDMDDAPPAPTKPTAPQTDDIVVVDDAPPAPTKPTTPQTDDIVVDDDTPAPATKQPAVEVEDEYFELDGF